jgi:hypothetical protein
VGGFFVGIKPLEFNKGQRKALSSLLLNLSQAYLLSGFGSPLLFKKNIALTLTAFFLLAILGVGFAYLGLTLLEE